MQATTINFNEEIAQPLETDLSREWDNAFKCVCYVPNFNMYTIMYA